MLSVSALLLGAKLVSAGKEMAVAWRYGTGSDVDAYLLAFTIVSWMPAMLVAAGTVVFVPRLVGLVAKVDERVRFVAELNGTFILLGLLGTALPLVCGPLMVEWVASALPAETRHLTAALVLQLSPLAPLMVFSGYLAIRLQAREKQGYTLLEAMPAIGILAFVLLAPVTSGVGPLIWGTIVGSILQLVWSLRMVRHADGTLGALAFAHRSPHWQAIYGAIGIMALGQFVMGFSSPVDQYYAAKAGGGAVATLGYANRVISLASGLGAIAIARALLPVMSEVAARDQQRLGYAQTMRWTWLMLVAGMLAVLSAWLLAPWIVSLLFERGAFGAEDTRRVAHTLKVGLFQLPFLFSGIVLVQWIAALGSYRVLFFAAVAAIVVKIAFNELMIESLGLDSVMYATAGMYGVSWLVQILYVRWVRSGVNG